MSSNLTIPDDSDDKNSNDDYAIGTFKWICRELFYTLGDAIRTTYVVYKLLYLNHL